MIIEGINIPTNEELAAGIYDEYEVLYSEDGKKLLKCSNNELQNYRVKEGTEIICEAAFENVKLISIELPASLISIGPSAFMGCSSLASVKIPDNVATVCDSAFCGCSSLTSVKIPDNVATVCDSAFARCSSLGTATLGKSVTFIEGSAFLGCISMTDIFVSGENEHYCSLGGVLYTKDMTELVYCPGWKPFDGFVFPESVTKIGDYAFSDFPALATLNIPGGIAVIGIHAFAGCKSLASVTIGSGVKEIGQCAFGFCDALTSLTINEGVSVIGKYAFCNCPLTCVEIPRGVRKIEEGAFHKCGSLESVTIPESVAYIGEAVFGFCPKLERIISLNPLPPIVEFDAFKEVDKNSCVLAVPVGSKQGYASADYWAEFMNIEEINS